MKEGTIKRQPVVSSLRVTTGFVKNKRYTPSFYILAIVTTLAIVISSNRNFGVLGQSSSSSSLKSCLCGVDRVPCEKNLTSSDCPNGRVISRRDCTCCFICAKQLTEECNNFDALCDSDYGLECGSDKRCKAKTQCSDDTSCSSDLMCVGGACADPCKVLPDVCKEANMTTGICVSRNHRALCSCSPGKSLNSNKECVGSNEESKKCESDGRQVNPGENVYKDKCSKTCKCESSGELSCEDAKNPVECNSGFIPMSKVSGEMSEACKILIGNATLFDGCCVPEKCQNVKSQDNPAEDSKGGRDFKLTESHNNLGEEDEKSNKQKLESTKEFGDATSLSSTNLLMGKEGDGLKQVTVLKRTDHSAVINLPKNDKEAILSISLSKELSKDPGSSQVWKEHRIPAGLPQITLSDLLANTSYTLKYAADGKDYPSVQFITDDADKPKEASSAELMLPTSSEMVDSSEMDQMPNSGEGSVTGSSAEMGSGSGSEESTTHPESSIGCLYNGTSYETGEIFYRGCDERCECMKNGDVKCMERCSIPMFKRGAFSHDKMCYEEPSGIDDCCVIIACARGSTNGAGEARELISIVPQACEAVKCGMNARCIGPTGMLTDEEQQTNQTLCVCNENFIGDPYDEVHGCQQNATPTAPSDTSSSTSSATPPLSSTVKPDGCVFKNKTYEFGAEEFDECSYKCRCETSGEFLCVPRCNYRRDEEKEIPAGCEVQKDPSDLECCEMLVCHGEPLESGTRKDSPTVPSDGCIYKNKTYVRDVKFYDGCDHQCMCFSNGDVTCQPRCPPAATSLAATTNGNDNCVTLPDPTDKCCTVTVCGNSTLSDVMKAANETAFMNMQSSTLPSQDMMTTTIIPSLGEGRSPLARNLSPFSIRISMINPINDTAIMVSIQILEKELSSFKDEIVTVKYSPDLNSWKDSTAKVKDLVKAGSEEISLPITGLSPGKEYYFKVKINESESNTASGFTKNSPMVSSIEDDFGSSETLDGASQELDMSGEIEDESAVTSAEKLNCTHKGKSYEYAEEFYDECESYCACERGGKLNCVKIECPKDGLELLDDSCVRWEPDAKDFRKEAPNCCPAMTCVQHSSCVMENGLIFRNFDEIPQKITGCDKRCYCEFGNITCQNLCPPMPQHPPANLPCPQELARAVTMPNNDCCYQWVCPLPPHHHSQNSNESNGSNKLQNNLEGTMLNKTKTRIPNDLLNSNLTLTRPQPFENGTHIHSPFDHSHEHDGEHDQFVPPSTGNQPTLVSLDKINPHQLQELLHQLSALGGEGGDRDQPGHGHDNAYSHAGTYVQVQTPQQVRELEKDVGAKFVEQAEDGSYILVIPNAGPNYPDQTYSDHLGQGHGPPYAHAPPPPGGEQFGPFGLNPYQRPPHGQHERAKVANIVIHPLNETTLQIDFTVSPILVGLQGHVEVLYTREFEHKPNPAQWDRKVFQQAEDLIDNTHLQLFLTSLVPDTEYHMQIKVVVVQADLQPTSDILRVRTPPIPIPTTTLPPEILVDPEIQLTATGSNAVKVHWRKFTEQEKYLIDGVQITYKASDEKVYSTTPLIHRSLNEFELENLQSDKEYEINLLFIPFDSNQTTILKSLKPIFVKTNPAEDEYNFDIAIKNGKITESTLELMVDGVPHPEDKFVNIYQVIYMSDSQKEQKSYFKVPKRDTSKRATLTDLKPGTNYTVWLEAFLSNGKKKRSNVISIKTKDGSLPHPEKSGQENNTQDPRASSEQLPQPTSYYGALVALAIIAALSIIGIIALLMILIKKQNYAKAPINDRKSESSYDNPSFKSYDVESNGHHKPSDL